MLLAHIELAGPMVPKLTSSHVIGDITVISQDSLHPRPALLTGCCSKAACVPLGAVPSVLAQPRTSQSALAAIISCAPVLRTIGFDLTGCTTCTKRLKSSYGILRIGQGSLSVVFSTCGPNVV